MKFICLTFLLISAITDSISDQYVIVGPSDPVFAVAGEDVILPCFVKPNISIVDMRVEWSRLDLKNSLVHLYEDREDRNTGQIQSYRGRTELNHQELQRGNASLKLSSVKVSDEGWYKCLIKTKSWNDYATVDVKVEAVGSPPVITVDGFDGSGRLHLQCESDGWFPEPDLEWLDTKGVRLSPESTETHRNKDRFSVKQTIIVYHSEKKIHCRVKVKHHMLETQIITTSKMFNSWRTSVTVISVSVVLSVIAGVLIAVFGLKYRDYLHLQNERGRMREAYLQLQNENSQMEEDKLLLEKEKSRMKTDYLQVQNVNSRIKKDYIQLKNQNSRMKKALTHFREHTAVNVILDADSAHPRLFVSDDGKQVRVGNAQQETVDEAEEKNYKFDKFLAVLGKEGFSSQCFYFEVQVKGQTVWDLGVTRESADRKGLFWSPVNGYWTVCLRNGRYWALESSYVLLPLRVKPQRVGVFVDYEKGFVSFYEVESSSHIYSYTGQSFNEKLYPFVGLSGSWFLRSDANSAPLKICDDY